MLNKLRRVLGRNLVNIPGWRTNRKIIVIESDDWGSIRMPSKEVYNKLLNKGIPVDKSSYCRYDSLASEDDLCAFFETLRSFKDSKNNTPVITANALVANPDFNKIKESGFKEYYYELITDTFQKYPKHLNCFKLWNEGKREKIFYPQLHGREHLNVQLWLKLLQDKHPDFLFAFENNCWGLSNDIYPNMKMSVQAAFDMEHQDEITFQERLLKEACKIFENIFGYKSKTFIANNFVWDSLINKTLSENGVKYLQGMKYQKNPLLNYSKRQKVRHYLGESNEFGQYHLIRNCTFEPSQMRADFDNIGECLKDISNAFSWNKPAIISSHRLNYVGYIEEENRVRNLCLLSKLLSEIIKRWPKVEFLTSVDLGKIIEKDHKISS